MVHPSRLGIGDVSTDVLCVLYESVMEVLIPESVIDTRGLARSRWPGSRAVRGKAPSDALHRPTGLDGGACEASRCARMEEGEADAIMAPWVDGLPDGEGARVLGTLERLLSASSSRSGQAHGKVDPASMSGERTMGALLSLMTRT